MKRVVVSGIGLITSFGSSLDSFWTSLLTQPSGLKPLNQTDLAALSLTSPYLAGKVELDSKVLESLTVKAKQFGRNKQNGMALQAATSALEDSGLVLDSKPLKERTGVVLSCQSSQMSPAVFFADEITRSSFRALTLELCKHLSLSGPSINISKAFDLQGPSLGGGSGLSCVPLGVTSILEDQADVMLVGSSSLVLHPYYVHSPSLKGKNLADGSAVLVLEDLQHALNRKAKIYAEVKGFSLSFDQDRLRGVKKNLKEAAAAAGLQLNEVDLAGFEAKSDWDEVPVKTLAFFEEYLGFMPDGLGAIQAAIVLLMMKHQVVPQSLSGGKLGVFSNIKTAISTSFGSEGSISSVVFSSIKGKTANS